MATDGARQRRGQSRGGARRKARKKALDVLFEADLRGGSAEEVMARQVADKDAVPEYSRELVAGVVEHRPAIDDLLRTYSEGWELERMPAVDRNVLRIAVYELLYREDVPDVVAIDEAVALASELSTEDSPRFVNGVLGRLQLLR